MSLITLSAAARAANPTAVIITSQQGNEVDFTNLPSTGLNSTCDALKEMLPLLLEGLNTPSSEHGNFHIKQSPTNPPAIYNQTRNHADHAIVSHKLLDNSFLMQLQMQATTVTAETYRLVAKTAPDARIPFNNNGLALGTFFPINASVDKTRQLTMVIDGSEMDSFIRLVNSNSFQKAAEQKLTVKNYSLVKAAPDLFASNIKTSMAQHKIELSQVFSRENKQNLISGAVLIPNYNEGIIQKLTAISYSRNHPSSLIVSTTLPDSAHPTVITILFSLPRSFPSLGPNTVVITGQDQVLTPDAVYLIGDELSKTIQKAGFQGEVINAGSIVEWTQSSRPILRLGQRLSCRQLYENPSRSPSWCLSLTFQLDTHHRQ